MAAVNTRSRGRNIQQEIADYVAFYSEANTQPQIRQVLQHYKEVAKGWRTNDISEFFKNNELSAKDLIGFYRFSAAFAKPNDNRAPKDIIQALYKNNNPVGYVNHVINSAPTPERKSPGNLPNYDEVPMVISNTPVPQRNLPPITPVNLPPMQLFPDPNINREAKVIVQNAIQIDPASVAGIVAAINAIPLDAKVNEVKIVLNELRADVQAAGANALATSTGVGVGNALLTQIRDNAAADAIAKNTQFDDIKRNTGETKTVLDAIEAKIQNPLDQGAYMTRLNMELATQLDPKILEAKQKAEEALLKAKQAKEEWKNKIVHPPDPFDNTIASNDDLIGLYDAMEEFTASEQPRLDLPFEGEKETDGNRKEYQLLRQMGGQSVANILFEKEYPQAKPQLSRRDKIAADEQVVDFLRKRAEKFINDKWMSKRKEVDKSLIFGSDKRIKLPFMNDSVYKGDDPNDANVGGESDMISKMLFA